MDVVLLTLTTLSLAAAAGFGALSWRVGREERERARARMAALSTAMAPPSPETPLLAGVAVGSIVERAGEGLRGRPLIKAAAGVMMALTIGIGVVIGTSWGGFHGARSSRVIGPPAPLELVSMRYQRRGTTLTVSGLVRNPAAGAAASGVTAVVSAFDNSGGFMASGRAPLDFSALGPGDESPFVVDVQNVAEVARYRVTFRSGNGVVRHIDRRGGRSQLAQAVR